MEKKTQPTRIELNHLSPYLPYKLEILREGKVTVLCGLSNPYKTINGYFINGETKKPNGTYRETCSFYIEEKNMEKFKPILRPMSELTRQMLEAVGFECCSDYLTHEFNGWVEKCGRKHVIDNLPYGHATFLFSEKFDVFGLIEAGLAIDVNSLT